VREDDGGGGASVSWIPVEELWASITPTGGGESVQAEKMSAQITHNVFLRYRADISSAMRIRFGARILDILAVIDVDERRHVLRCYCREELL